MTTTHGNPVSRNTTNNTTAEKYYWIDDDGQIHIGVRWVVE